LERIHQYTRCIDGFVTTGPGQGKKDFKSRTELFIGPGHQDLMGRAVEHLHKVATSTPYFKIGLTKQEAVIEHIARTTLARILLNETLWQHFTNTEFCAKPVAERQAIWGPPIDPMVALA